MSEPVCSDPVQVTSDSEETPLAEPGAREELVEEDLLVEDVSIDGMCGVY